MVEQEEKRWLRALLEGEVEPGSEEWEQVCTDSAFTRVREKVGAVARLDFTQQEDEVEGMWRVLVDRRKKGLERRARGRKRDGCVLCWRVRLSRRMVVDPGSGKRTGGCGRRKNGRGEDRVGVAEWREAGIGGR